MLKYLRSGVALAVLASLLVTPALVAADPPVIVNPIFCLVNGFPDTAVTVPAGSTVIIRWGWVADNLGLVRAFLGAVDFSISIDGTPIADTDQSFGPIVSFPDFDADGDNEFITRWTFNAGVLGVGTHSIDSDLSLSGGLPDLLIFVDGKPFIFGPGTINLAFCSITVV